MEQPAAIRFALWWGLAAVVVASTAGCTVGGHHHRIDTTVQQSDHRAEVTGTVDGVDLGVVGDFRYFRLGLPYEGQRHRLEVRTEEGGSFDVDDVFELRTLRLDIPVWSILDFSGDSSGHWYPGALEERHTLDLWLSGSVGVAPISPATASVGVVYYRYGAFAARVYGGIASDPYRGVTSDGPAGEANRMVRHEGRAPGIVVGVEMTLAAGEYALELAEYILDIDRDIRDDFGAAAGP